MSTLTRRDGKIAAKYLYRLRQLCNLCPKPRMSQQMFCCRLTLELRDLVLEALRKAVICRVSVRELELTQQVLSSAKNQV